MAIKKRLTPADRLQAKTEGTFNKMCLVPILKGLVNTSFISYVNPSPENIANVVSKFFDKSWMTSVPWTEKIFVYIYGMVARRANVPGLIDDDRMTQLARHMNAQTTIDKIDSGEANCGLAFRQVFIWDLPAFLERYKAPGSLTLPEPYATPSKPRKRLKKHDIAASKPERPKRTRLAKHR